ncbi:tetratricopeptide repeat protein [Pseudomonas sp. EL_65y_Pfl2_R96]|uniref:tetratricopeptide repeat protein n=1 Tax=Pseudomonas sp. EL_65y_Pfl2_R96 TaxID=3088699 RepID=UPI0030D94D15
MKLKELLSTATLFFLFSSIALAQLSPEQKSAKDQGLIFYNQLKSVSATPFLAIAAEAGDQEAQYFLAESLRKKNHYMNPESQKWYEAAAEQGDLYAMIQLGRNTDDLCKKLENCATEQKAPIEWLKQAQSIAKPKAENGDAESMYIMYELTVDKNWLKRAADAGHPIAQYWMGITEMQGEGFFLPWQRQESIEKWFKASAEGGYPKGMREYAVILGEKKDMEGYRQWNEKAALTGYASSIFEYGSDLAHEPDLYGYPLDIVKGYALIYLLKELDGGGGMQADVKDQLHKTSSKITSKQIIEAEKFAETWKATHPPVSFFPEKLSR